MRWILLVVSILVGIPFPSIGAVGILLALILPALLHPEPIPDGYHAVFDPATNGSKIVKDETPETPPPDASSR